MGKWQNIVKQRKPLIFLLVASLLLLTLLPAHFHLHHISDDDSIAHSHAVDLHIITDKSSHTHNSTTEGDSITIVSPSPEGLLIEKIGSVASVFLLLFFVIVLFSFNVNANRNHPGQYYTTYPPTLRHSYVSPPLRAPPLY